MTGTVANMAVTYTLYDKAGQVEFVDVFNGTPSQNRLLGLISYRDPFQNPAYWGWVENYGQSAAFADAAPQVCECRGCLERRKSDASDRY